MPFDGMTRAGMPRSIALARPGAPSRLLITNAIWASGRRPAATLSAKASKFEPRPLRRTPIRFGISGEVSITRRSAPNESDRGYWHHLPTTRNGGIPPLHGGRPAGAGRRKTGRHSGRNDWAPLGFESLGPNDTTT